MFFRKKFNFLISLIIVIFFISLVLYNPGSNLYAEKPESTMTLEEASETYSEIGSLVKELPGKEIGLSRKESIEQRNRIIIKYKSGSTPLGIIKGNYTALSKKQKVLIDKNLLSVEIPSNMTIIGALKHYNARADIEYAEEDFGVGAFWSPDDTLYISGDQWNFTIIDAEKGWEIAPRGGSSNVVVAVVDTGVAYEDYSPYIRASDLSSLTFVAGYDFIWDDTHPNDDNKHGTHIAGTIAQTTNNSYGCAGLAFNVKIMPIKVLDADGNGFVSDIVAGINWAAEHGADVINLSLGGPDYSLSLHESVKNAKNNGVIAVCASGNSNGPVLYPAAHPETIAVGAIDSSKNRCSFSNYGNKLDFVAPGELIVQEAIKGGGDYSTGFYYASGTSMACPHVAALAALVLSVYPSLGYDGVKTKIIEGCEDLGNSGFDNYYGYGLINVYRTLGGGAEPVDNVQAFVTRFYQQCLGREPDAGGLSVQVNALTSGSLTGAQLAYNFIFSPEFLSRNVSSSDFLYIMYRAFFDREPDTGGYNNWMDYINSGKTRAFVLAGFVNSTEFKNLCSRYGITAGLLSASDIKNAPTYTSPPPSQEESVPANTNVQAFVTRFYQQCLGREPDAGGLSVQVNALTSGSLTGAQLAYNFIFSPEFLSRNVSSSDFLYIMYRAFFDREPDTGGYNNWMDYINSGKTRAFVLAGFVNSVEFKDLCSRYGIVAGSLK